MNKVKTFFQENSWVKYLGLILLCLIGLWWLSTGSFWTGKKEESPKIPVVTTTPPVSTQTNTKCVSDDDELIAAQKKLLELQGKKVEIKRHYEEIARNEEYLNGKKVITKTVYRKVYSKSNNSSSSFSNERRSFSSTNISTSAVANEDCWAKIKPDFIKKYGLKIEMRGQQAMVVYPDGTPYKGEYGQPFVGGSVKQGSTEVIGGSSTTSLKKLKPGYHRDGAYIISEKTGMKVTQDDYPFEDN